MRQEISMEVEVLKKEKNNLELKFNERNQGILNLIKSTLWQDKATQVASFRIEHPEIGQPIFVLKTKGKEAKKVWNDALEKLASQIDKLKEKFKSF